MAKAKAAVVVQQASKDPMAMLANLAKIAPQAKADTKDSKKKNRPTLSLVGVEAHMCDRYNAANKVKLTAEDTLKETGPELKKLGRADWLRVCFEGNAAAENVLVCGSQSSLVATEKGPYKVKANAASADPIEDVRTELRNALSKELLLNKNSRDAIVTSILALVELTPCTTIMPLQELFEKEESKPVVQKVLNFMATLSQDERDLLISNTPKFTVDANFHDSMIKGINAAVGNVSTAVKVAAALAVMGVVYDVQAATGSKFDGSIDEALTLLRNADNKANADGAKTVTTTTTKVTEKVAA